MVLNKKEKNNNVGFKYALRTYTKKKNQKRVKSTDQHKKRVNTI